MESSSDPKADNKLQTDGSPADDVIDSVFEPSPSDESAKEARDASDSITFWNIDEQPSIVDTNTYMDNSVSAPDSRCFQVSKQLKEELAKCGRNGGDRYSASYERKLTGPNQSVNSLTDHSTPPESDNVTKSKGANVGESAEGKSRKGPLSSNCQTNEDNTDSDIVEINLDFDSLEENGKQSVLRENVFKTVTGDNQKQMDETISSFKFTENINSVQTNAGDPIASDIEDPWFIGIEDTENIFTKSLILSGITQPQISQSHKRLHDQDSPEQQAKRVKREHVNVAGHNEGDRIKFTADPTYTGENSEFCPPVAIVFPMEAEQDSQRHFETGACKTGNDTFKPPVSEMKLPNDSEKLENSKNECKGVRGELKAPEQGMTAKDTQSSFYSAKDMITAPKVETFGNLDFDIEFADSKDDFSIDITPTINHLDEYEEVLAGLIRDSHFNRDTMNDNMNGTSTANIMQFKDQGASFTPPNVTCSSAMNAQPFNKWPVSSYPPNIAKNIESIMTCNTMKPGMSLSGPFQQVYRPQQPQIPRMPHEHSGHLNMLQSFSLHSDSNLLRKMISTPITDDPRISQGSGLDSHISKTATKDNEQSNEDSATHGLPDNTGNLLGDTQAGQMKQEISRSQNHISDKPAISEQVRARVTLHHTGEKDHDLMASNGPAAGQPAHTVYPPHSQQQMPTRHIMDRGVQDVLLQHSLRRKQQTMHQMYGGQSVPPSYSSSMFPTGFPPRPGFNISDFDQLAQQRRKPFPLAHMQNYASNSSDHLTKPNMTLMDKVYNTHNMHQRHNQSTSENLLETYNPYQRDINASYPLSHRMSPKEQFMQQMQERNPYVQQNVTGDNIPAVMPRSSQASMHELLTPQEKPVSQMPTNGKLMTQLPGQTSMSVLRYPGQFQRELGQPTRFPNFPGHPRQYMTASSVPQEQHQRFRLPMDWDDKQANPRLAFMSDYYRQQMSRQMVDPSGTKPMAGMHLAMSRMLGDRTVPISHGNGDLAVRKAPQFSSGPVLPGASDPTSRNNQQYPMGMTGHPPNFGVQ